VIANLGTFFPGSQVYDPVALLRREDETLIIARVGMKASKRFMILTPLGDPAWPHEPFGSLSDVSWSLRAHQWHSVTPEPVGPSRRLANALARLLADRA
jgi:hypothetical protein